MCVVWDSSLTTAASFTPHLLLSGTTIHTTTTMLIVGIHLLGAAFFQTGVRRWKYKLGSTKQFVPRILLFVPRILLRWAEFIFPPPHPSLKECCSQEVNSYDQCVLPPSALSHRIFSTPHLLLSISTSISILLYYFDWWSVFFGIIHSSRPNPLPQMAQTCTQIYSQ